MSHKQFEDRSELKSVSIANMMTLRYDPSSHLDDSTIRNVSSEDLLKIKQDIANNRTNVPPLLEVENEIGQEIKTRINGHNAKRISVALSSGVDSNVIFTLIRKAFPNIEIECLNVTFDDNSSEAKEAEAIANSNNAGFHEIHIDNPLKDLPKLLSIVKEPRWNVYQYYFIESARSISNMLFTGDGGDELFAGYIFRYEKFLGKLRSLKRITSWEDRTQAYLACHERDWVPDQEHMFAGTKVNFCWLAIYQMLRKYFDNVLDPIEQVLLADYHGKLMYDFIPTNEKFFKYFDIIAVAPLLCSKIIDLVFRIPTSLKYDVKSNTGKVQLREILKRNGIWNHNEDNRKIGFGMDLPKLWSTSGKEVVTSYLDKGRIFEDNIINREWYDRSLIRMGEISTNKNESSTNARYISKMLQLLSLEIWYRLFITTEIPAHYSL